MAAEILPVCEIKYYTPLGPVNLKSYREPVYHSYFVVAFNQYGCPLQLTKSYILKITKL